MHRKRKAISSSSNVRASAASSNRTDPTDDTHARTDPSLTLFPLGVPRDIMCALRPAARARDSSVDRLILDLLATVAAEPDLARAILDD